MKKILGSILIIPCLLFTVPAFSQQDEESESIREWVINAFETSRAVETRFEQLVQQGMFIYEKMDAAFLYGDCDEEGCSQYFLVTRAYEKEDDEHPQTFVFAAIVTIGPNGEANVLPVEDHKINKLLGRD